MFSPVDFPVLPDFNLLDYPLLHRLRHLPEDSPGERIAEVGRDDLVEQAALHQDHQVLKLEGEPVQVVQELIDQRDAVQGLQAQPVQASVL